MSSDITALKRSLTRLLAVYVVGTFLFFSFCSGICVLRLLSLGLPS